VKKVDRRRQLWLPLRREMGNKTLKVGRNRVLAGQCGGYCLTGLLPGETAALACSRGRPGRRNKKLPMPMQSTFPVAAWRAISRRNR
jgi:hypothetical protein